MSEEYLLRREITQFLARHSALTLAYADEGGVGACGLWYAADDAFNLYFLSSPSTRHGKALADGGEVAFTIHKDEQDWTAITGLQGTGRCAVVAPRGTQAAWAVYTRRFPFVLQQFDDLDAALRKSMLWHITPTWLRLIDNTTGFGSKRELTLLNLR